MSKESLKLLTILQRSQPSTPISILAWITSARFTTMLNSSNRFRSRPWSEVQNSSNILVVLAVLKTTKALYPDRGRLFLISLLILTESLLISPDGIMCIQESRKRGQKRQLEITISQVFSKIWIGKVFIPKEAWEFKVQIKMLKVWWITTTEITRHLHWPRGPRPVRTCSLSSRKLILSVDNWAKRRCLFTVTTPFRNGLPRASKFSNPRSWRWSNFRSW